MKREERKLVRIESSEREEKRNSIKSGQVMKRSKKE
jgi:hypothetical protein